MICLLKKINMICRLKQVYKVRPDMLSFYTERKKNEMDICLPLSSADYLGKQFGPRSGLTNCQA